MAKSKNGVVIGYSIYIRFSFLVQKVRCVEYKLMVVVGRWRHEGAQRLGSIPTILKYIPTQSQLDMYCKTAKSLLYVFFYQRIKDLSSSPPTITIIIIFRVFHSAIKIIYLYPPLPPKVPHPLSGEAIIPL